VINLATAQNTQHLQNARTALVIAGGTGGHIFPGLAIAGLLRERGWNVHWIGGKSPSMESQLVPKQEINFLGIEFSGVRGKGWRALVDLPIRLLKASKQSLKIINEIRPDVLIGLGGYITVPPCLMGRLMGKPLILHEQNSVAGSANKLLTKLSRNVFTAFPGVLMGEWVGNPLRENFSNQEPPEIRLANREGPLRVLIVGGSLGAKALNTIVPQAIARIPKEQKIQVLHQGGAKQIDELRLAYQREGLQEGENIQLVPFIDDMASSFANADLVICRAGASTVCELAAIGVAAIYVPFPYAVDDHQTINAKFIVDSGGGWLIQQKDLDAEKLSELIVSISRKEILQKATKAYSIRKIQATEKVVQACEEIVI